MMFNAFRYKLSQNGHLLLKNITEKLSQFSHGLQQIEMQIISIALFLMARSTSGCAKKYVNASLTQAVTY